jgi:RNA polymerase sigma factor (sigma-70 family)
LTDRLFHEGPAIPIHPEAVTADDGETIARVYQSEITRLVALARVLTGDRQAGEDLAHDVFIRLVRANSRTPHYLQEPAWPWLRTTLVRLAAQRRRQLLRELRRLSRLEQQPSREYWSDSNVDTVAALRDLPPRMRACVVLHYCEDLSIADVAKTLDCAPDTVKVQLARGRKRLRAVLRTPITEHTGA